MHLPYVSKQLALLYTVCCSVLWPLCDLYAKADCWNQWFWYAH